MRVLIVDDEVNICKLIKNLVNWDALGLELVGFAHSGAESLKMIEAHMPEIVITDICMPGKSGLEIIKECMERSLNINFIIISGHAEFDYARQAVRYGVSDFLLKPINRDELTEALQQIKSRVIGLSREQLAVTEALENSRNISRITLPMSLYHRDFETKYQGIEAINSELGFHFKEGIFFPVVIKLLTLDKQQAADKQLSYGKNILSQQKVLIEKELQAICNDFCVCERRNSLLCIFNFAEYKINDFRIVLQYTFDLLLNMIAPSNLYLAVMGTGAPVRQLKRLQTSFLQAVCACDSHLCLGNNRIINGADMDIRLMNTALINVEEPNRTLKPYIEILDAENIRQSLRSELNRQMPDIKLYPYSINSYMSKFITAFLRDIADTHNNRDIQENGKHILAEIYKCRSLDEASNSLVDQLCRLMEELQAKSPDNKAIILVKNYIEQCFSHHIRLEDAASRVYLSPAYLGILFKRETGQNFSDYIVAVRIEKAKEMLKDNRYNINEIADSVGYKDARYFSKLFKNIVGIKPTQYRKLYARGGNNHA